MHNYDLSIIIPARNEMFLAKTIEDILKNKRGKTEIIVGLDGEWANPRIPDHDDITILYVNESIGQRALTNACVRLSKAKWIMKVDAHCSFDEGFDVKILEGIKDNWTVAPTMYNLHVFDWVCTSCGHRIYQGPSTIRCDRCEEGKKQNTMKREMVWERRKSTQNYSYRCDSTLHFQYWGEYKTIAQQQGDWPISFTLQGSAFMLTKQKYFELNICDEEWGSWGNQGTEVAFKTWLSGGEVHVCRKTWYAHLFRTQGSDFSFPYPQSGRQIDHARKRSREIFLKDKWEKQVYPLAWLLEKFKPIPGWHDKSGKEVLDQVMKSAIAFTGVNSIADLTSALSTTWLSKRKKMTSNTMSSSSLLSAVTLTSQNVDSMSDQSKMNGITTSSNTTNVINNRNISPEVLSKRTDKPGIHDSMDSDFRSIESDSSISEVVDITSPNPASIRISEIDLGKNTRNGFGIELINSKNTHIPHYTHTQEQKSTPKQEILYFTDNQLNVKIAKKVQKQLQSIGLPIRSVSLKPMSHFGQNIYIPLKRGVLTYFQQILAGLEASKADIIYFCEHDILYHPSHFDFIPSTKDKFYYNQNFWKVRLTDNFAVHWDANQVSGLVCYRELAISWYKQKIEEIIKQGFNRSYEPGGRNSDVSVAFKSEFSNIDIRHEGTLTKNKWSPNDFRDKSTCVNWQEGTLSAIPGWKFKNGLI